MGFRNVTKVLSSELQQSPAPTHSISPFTHLPLIRGALHVASPLPSRSVSAVVTLFHSPEHYSSGFPRNESPISREHLYNLTEEKALRNNSTGTLEGCACCCCAELGVEIPARRRKVRAGWGKRSKERTDLFTWKSIQELAALLLLLPPILLLLLLLSSAARVYFGGLFSIPQYSHNVAQLEASLNEGTALVVTGRDSPPASWWHARCIRSLHIIIQRHVGQVAESDHGLRATALDGHVPTCHTANHSKGQARL